MFFVSVFSLIISSGVLVKVLVIRLLVLVVLDQVVMVIDRIRNGVVFRSVVFVKSVLLVVWDVLKIELCWVCWRLFLFSYVVIGLVFRVV